VAGSKRHSRRSSPNSVGAKTERGRLGVWVDAYIMMPRVLVGGLECGFVEHLGKVEAVRVRLRRKRDQSAL